MKKEYVIKLDDKDYNFLTKQIINNVISDELKLVLRNILIQLIVNNKEKF